MKFTKEEISLCKQVAEKHRKKIEYGSWYWCKITGKIYLCTTGKIEDRLKSHFPLWTIFDCLEFLKSKSFYGRLSDVGSYYEANYTKTIVGKNDIAESIELESGIVKTPLEALLKSVLAVLEDK